MATTSIAIIDLNTDNDIKVVFTAVDQNFTLGADHSCFDSLIVPKLNFASIGLDTDGASVTIKLTSGLSVTFIAKAAADLTGVDMAVTSVCGIAIVSGTVVDCNKQAMSLIKECINW